jgi:signal transduction histidine kinase
MDSEFEPGRAQPAASHLLTRLMAQMVETSDALGATADPRARLRGIVSRAREITNARYGALSVFGEQGTLEQFIFEGIDERLAQSLGSLPTGRGLLGVLAGATEPLRLDDLRRHAAFTGWPEGHPPMAAFMGVPLRAAGMTIGSLYLTRKEGEPTFTETDELAAVMLGLQASAVVAIALAQEREQRLNVLEERQSIAHDLHDGTIQTLYAIGLRMSGRRDLPNFPEEFRQQLDVEIAMLDDLVRQIRNYISALEQPAFAARPDLAADLAQLLRTVVPEHVHTVLNIRAVSLQEVPARAVEDLLFIAREAMSNAVRHGSPTRLAIDVRETSHEFALTIQDDGTGFEQVTARVGLGTITMRTRAERIGGEVTILSIPGMGTTVRVTRPRLVPGG